MKPSEIFFGLLRIPTDFFMALFAFLLAYRLRYIPNLIPGLNLPLTMASFPPLEEYIVFSVIASGVLVILFGLNTMYSFKNPPRLAKEIRQIFVLTFFGLMLLMAYFFLIRSFPFSRLAIIYTWALSIILIIAGRMIIRFFENISLQFGIGKKSILFIGSNDITSKISTSLKKDNRYQIIGCIDQKYPHEITTKTPKFLGKIENLPKIIQKYRIEEVLQTNSDLPNGEATQILELCREHHIDFSFVPNLLEVQQTNIETETWSGIPIIKLKPTPLDGWGRVLKRIFDLVIASIALIILAIPLLLIALAIKLDSKGTIFFKYLDDGSRVKRVGQYGKLFNFYKFRTMYPNTHNLRYTELAANNTRKGSPLIKIKNDPRVTRIGKFLRKTSLDELPQLFNVIKGEISLVGPRPHLPEEVEKYQKHHKFVLTIKPGITGMAQISGRSDLNFEEEVKLDTYYIEHWSLWLDLKILLKTLPAVLRGYKE